jgi:hypothetical protein
MRDSGAKLMARKGKYPGKPSGRGKGVLQQAVHEAGVSRRQSVLIVDTVIDCWKDALARDEDVELPIGTLHTVKRKTRRVFKRKPNLKNFKHHLYEVNRKPFGVQLVKKQLWVLNPLPQELAEASVCSAPPGAANESSTVDSEDRRFRPVRFAYLNQHDLLQRFRW